jgi:CHASE3 domain sensor protein
MAKRSEDQLPDEDDTAVGLDDVVRELSDISSECSEIKQKIEEFKDSRLTTEWAEQKIRNLEYILAGIFVLLVIYMIHRW